MAKLVNNRLVNVWRGTDAPPTIHHVWIKNDELIYIYDDEIDDWKIFSEFPDLKVEATETPGIVQITCGDGSISLTVQGDALGINTNSNGLVTITSDALNKIDTEAPLTWNPIDKTLTHDKTLEDGIVVGPLTDLTNSETLHIPNITVDEYGHVTEAYDRTVILPAYVELTVLDENSIGVYPIILSSSTTSGHAGVLKDTGIYVEYVQDGDLIVHRVHIPDIDISGNLVIKGNITVEGSINGTHIVGDIQGTATPTDHADISSKYGAASTEFYGHVKLLDEFPIDELGQVLLNNDGTLAIDEGVAASPLLVYNTAKEVVTQLLDGITPEIEDNDNNLTKLPKLYKFSNDFIELNDKIFINWLEI